MIERQARDLIQSVERELKPLTLAANLADWEASTTGRPDAQERAAAAESRLRKFLSSRARFVELTKLIESAELQDPLLRRQLQLLALDHRPNLLAEQVIDDLVHRGKQIQSEFYTFRAQLAGREVSNNEIHEILRRERDEAQRRAAWEASKQIADRVAEPLLELVRRRNDAARSLGFRDYYAMRLQLQEIDEAELYHIFAELKERTAEPFRQAKADVDRRLAERYDTTPEALRPWHYEDPFFQEPPLSEELGLGRYFAGRELVEIATRFYEGIGLPVDDILARSDLYERAGKDQHAYCTDIDREGDVRILCNLRDDERWMGTLLHELGHAVYDKFIPRSLPWGLRQPAHIATTEAIAMFTDRLVYDIEWLDSAASIIPDSPERFAERARQALRFEMLLIARWVLVMTHFERQLYANPVREALDSYWWELVEELQLLRRPEGRASPDWAAKIHLAVAPVYYHNYLLGELTASQLGSAFRRDHLAGRDERGYVDCKQLGAFLRDDVFAHGASLHWQDLLEQATGTRLAADAFLEEFL